MGEVLSVNVAEVRKLERQGELVETGIWKLPVEGRVPLRGVSVEGDVQADPSVHGGHDLAVYAYAREDTDWWEAELDRPLEHGVFGENLTLTGIDVNGARIGERWRVGTALLEVSAARIPCWKLGRRMGDPGFVKRFAKAGRPGAYLRILGEGDVGAGDTVEVVERPDHDVTVALLSHVVLHDHSQAARLLEAPALAKRAREWAEQKAAA